MNSFRAAAVQLKGSLGLEGNLATAEGLIDQAVEDGADLVVLPENFAYYGLRDLATAAADEVSAEGPARAFVRRQARENEVWILAGTIPIPAAVGDRPAAASLLVSPKGEEVACYNKIHLFDVEVAETGKSYRESDDYRAGDQVVVAELPWCKLGMSVCYDLRFPELYRQQVTGGARVLAAPSAFTAATGKAHWQLLLRARAVENLCYVIAPNMADRDHPTHPTWGGSAIIDPWGRVMDSLDGEEGFVIADINLDAQDKIRRSMPALEHRKLG